GYRAGVGKTYEMVWKGMDLYKEGVDIKIGYIEGDEGGERSGVGKEVGEIKRCRGKFGSDVFEFMEVNEIVEGDGDVVVMEELGDRNM
ncbi:histidine kinase, partial [Staphylococcus capitis]|uniref:hypothetical protein n=1 Tax=Staphylococcus capitis TaxID=29388 RepID=UPI0011A999BB